MGNSLYGQKSTLGANATGLSINIEDQVVNFPKLRRELITRLDGSNFKKAVQSHEYKWSNRDNRPMKANFAVSAASNATVFIVDEPGVFNVDDQIQVADAQFVVESVAGGVELTVRKIHGTQAAYTGANEVVIIGGGTPQGKNADNMVIKGFEDFYNYTSNFEDVVDLSDMEHNAMIRGEEGSGELIARKQMELTEKLQRSLVASRRTVDKSRKTTTMGGMIDMIDLYAPQNAIDFGGSATWSADADVEDVIDDALDIIGSKAFDKPVMYVTPAFMRRFKRIQDDLVRTDASPSARGTGVVRTYRSHTFGDIDVVQLQGLESVMSDYVIMADESQMGFKAHKGLQWQTYPLARMGQSFRWQVAGVYTFKMDVPEAAVYLHNLGL